MLRAWTILLLVLWTASASAQPASIDPPLVGRPDGFSNIVGKYDIQVSAEPTEVSVEEPITLRIRIVGSGPAKYEPSRKHLDIFPKWDDDFYVQEMRDEHRVERDKKTWLFVYRLKPKHAKITAIDGITLIYYDPDERGKSKFITVPADAIPLKVKPKPQSLSEEAPAAVPDSFLECAPATEVLAHSAPFSPGWILLLAVLIGMLLACMIGALAWKRIYPDARVLKERRRTGAAQCALAELRRGEDNPWSIVCRYLRDRLDFAAMDATPREVGRFLKRRGFALGRCALAEDFFSKCDAARYTEASFGDAEALAAQAVRLIESLEADRCAG